MELLFYQLPDNFLDLLSIPFCCSPVFHHNLTRPGNDECSWYGLVTENGWSLRQWGMRRKGIAMLVEEVMHRLQGFLADEKKRYPVTEFIIQVLNVWHFRNAGWTPGCPEIQEDHTVLKVCEFDPLSVE